MQRYLLIVPGDRIWLDDEDDDEDDGDEDDEIQIIFILIFVFIQNIIIRALTL